MSLIQILVVVLIAAGCVLGLLVEGADSPGGDR